MGEPGSKVVSLEEAGRMIARHKVISLAGSHSVNSPMALIRSAIRAGAKGLTIIPPVTTAMASDLLIAAGCVEKFYLSYMETFTTPYGTFLICLDCKQDCAGVGPGRTSWEAGSAQRKG